MTDRAPTQSRWTALAAQRRRIRPVTRADLASFRGALAGPQRGAAWRSAVDGARVVFTLSRQGLRPLLRPGQLPERDPAHGRDVAVAVDAGLALLPVAATCLRRSVTLLRELRRTGNGATLHLGVRVGPYGVEAHAWVTVADEVVNDDPVVVATYAVLSAGEAERLLPTFR